MLTSKKNTKTSVRPRMPVSHMHVNIRSYTRTHLTHTHAQTYTHLHTYPHAHTHTYTHTYLFKSTHAHAQSHAHADTAT